jgi:hypothetical protein
MGGKKMRKLLFVLLVLPLIALGSVPLSHACCVDQDGDGYGTSGLLKCLHPELDCDDTRADVNPGATEICNDIDDNCDGIIDDVDADEDGFIAEACGGLDCDDANADINPEAAEICNADDDNCNDVIDDVDADQDGFIDEACGGEDCDDANPAVNPAAVEGCCDVPTCKDQIDNDCDGRVDTKDPSCQMWCMPVQSSTMDAEVPTGSKRLNFLALLIVPFAAILILRRLRRD